MDKTIIVINLVCEGKFISIGPLKIKFNWWFEGSERPRDKKEEEERIINLSNFGVGFFVLD